MKNIYRVIEYFLISIFWVILILSPILLGNTKRIDWNHVYNAWSTILPFFIIFLISRFILIPYLFLKGKFKIFIFSVVFIILTGSLIISYERPDNVLDRRFPPPNDQEFPRMSKEREQRPKRLPGYFNFIFISILMIGFDTGLKASLKWIESEQQKTEADKESIESKLAFLKNQISPHFFMNTLNNIHSLIDIDKDEAKGAVIHLSKLMRHLLYESEVKTIDLKKEVNFINNYLDLMRLRFTDKVTIEFTNLIENEMLKIPPLLFTSFLENAFKHGISYQQKSFIKITLQKEGNCLKFKIENSNHSKPKSEHSGLGLTNTKNRLDLLYGNNYNLEVERSETRYLINLKVPV